MIEKAKNFFESWADRQKRTARVIPVNLRIHDRSTHDQIHKFYFKNWRRYLSKYFTKRPKSAIQRQLKKYESNRSRIKNWFLIDIFAMSIQLVKENHEFVRKETGKGKLRQFLEILWLSVYLPSMPENYYKFEWYDKGFRKKAKEYLHRYELKNVVYKAVNCNGKDNPLISVTDKLKFAEFCLEAGIPAVPTLGFFKGGNFDSVVGIELKGFKGDFFIKPVSGKGGKGAERIEVSQSGDYSLASKGISFSVNEFMAYYKKESLKPEFSDGFIIQPRIINHPSLEKLTGKAVATCRVVTIVNESGAPEAVVSVFRMPGKMTGVVDNSHAGGLASAVNMNTGVLDKASYLGVSGDLSRMSHHPDSGNLVEGFNLPYWDEVLKLAVQSHSLMNSRKIIGWDIAITESGPLVIEANAQPCTDIVQRRLRVPLGSHRFGELLLYHLKKSV